MNQKSVMSFLSHELSLQNQRYRFVSALVISFFVSLKSLNTRVVEVRWLETVFSALQDLDLNGSL